MKTLEEWLEKYTIEDKYFYALRLTGQVPISKDLFKETIDPKTILKKMIAHLEFKLKREILEALDDLDLIEEK